jgi:hypothetical protein
LTARKDELGKENPKMTTNDTIPAPTNTATHPTTAPMPLALAPAIEEPQDRDPSAVLDPTQLMQAAIEESGLGLEELDNLKVGAQFTVGDSVWAVGVSPPGRVDLRVVALFEGDQADLNNAHAPGDVRAYVMPLSGPPARAKAWACYTLSRAQPLVVLKSLMTQEKFVEELAAEYQALAGVRDSLFEDNAVLREALERVAAEAQKTTVAMAIRLAAMEKIANEGLAEVDGDDEEDDSDE